MPAIDRLHPDQAIERLLGLEDNRQSEILALDQAVGRIVAETIQASLPVPPFDKSPYDGYAFRGEDTQGASSNQPVSLDVIGEIAAGQLANYELQPGQAVKILTGGPVPATANVCYKFEKTRRQGDQVLIYEPVAPHKDIIPAGEDIQVGDLLVQEGDPLTVGRLGVLASQGYREVKVYRKPVVGLFSTGDELVPTGQALPAGKIYETTRLSLGAILTNLGFEVKDYGIVADDLDAISRRTGQVISQVDLLITTGGASVGDYDYAYSAIDSLGGQILFWKTAMKPGGSMLASRLQNKTVLNLSGNPAAAILAFYRVCLPYLYRLMGRKDYYPEKIPMILAHDFNKSSPGVRLLRGQLQFQEGRLYFQESPAQGNGVLSSFARCDALLEIPAGSSGIKAGTLLMGYRCDHLFGPIAR
ncbi:molybdopterin molybdotransferase MoeA [Hutsoniella sourekii]